MAKKTYQKTFHTHLASELDTLCNDFKKEHFVTFTQTNQFKLDTKVMFVATLFYEVYEK